MFDVKTTGTLSSDGQYEKKVHIAYDRVVHDKNCDINVLVLIEPPSIIDLTNQVRECAADFDLILTWNNDLLDLKNARKLIFGCCWIDWESFNPRKTNSISFNTSDKSYAPGHLLRQKIWADFRGVESLNGFKVISHKSPPRTPNKNFLFETSKYHIAVENEQRINWITEKIIDCFASRTIPIYWGAPNISEYFNARGVLTFNSIEDLHNTLKLATDKFYDDHLEIIEENYEKSKSLWHFHPRVRSAVEYFIGEHS
jgi:hypothetical protein